MGSIGIAVGALLIVLTLHKRKHPGGEAGVLGRWSRGGEGDQLVKKQYYLFPDLKISFGKSKRARPNIVPKKLCSFDINVDIAMHKQGLTDGCDNSFGFKRLGYQISRLRPLTCE